MTDLLEPMTLAHGPAWRNRFMMSPMTNGLADAEGRLSDTEIEWLAMRAKGGFGLVTTCASHVQRTGQGFAGQMGVFSDDHLPGLTRLASAIRAEGAASAVQLHHAGVSSPEALTGQKPVGPSDDAKTGARALTLGEVEQLIEDFVAAAVRAEKAGFTGVELHGAHGYIFGVFQSSEFNRREDRYGGSPENRARLLFDVIAGVRERTGPDFQLGVRLSPERFGLKFAEQAALAGRLLASGDLDYLDMSLSDVFRTPMDEAYASRPLIDWFAELPRGRTRLGAVGKIMAGADARRLVGAGADFVIMGRGAILHHDYPHRYAADPDFPPVPTPASPAYLATQGLTPPFVEYMKNWQGFVAEDADAVA